MTVHLLVPLSPVTALELDIRANDAHLSYQCVIPAERLLLCAQMTAHFLPGVLVRRVLVPFKIVTMAQNRVVKACLCPNI